MTEHEIMLLIAVFLAGVSTGVCVCTIAWYIINRK